MDYESPINQKSNVSYKYNIHIRTRKEKLSKQNILAIDTTDGVLSYTKICVVCHAEYTARRSDSLTCCLVCGKKVRRVLGKNESLPLSLEKKMKQAENKQQNKNRKE
jgi:hypothetical protein